MLAQAPDRSSFHFNRNLQRRRRHVSPLSSQCSFRVVLINKTTDFQGNLTIGSGECGGSFDGGNAGRCISSLALERRVIDEGDAILLLHNY